MACEKCGCSVRVRYCGEEWVVASDTNDDGVLEIGFEPRMVSYTGADPDPATALVLPDPADGSILPSGVFATNSDNQITHVAICGTWVEIAGSGGGTVVVPPDEAERVCYAIADWFIDGPATFGGGCDEWVVNGDNVADDICPAIPSSFCVSAVLSTFEYGSGGQSVPPGGWGQFDWGILPGVSGCATQIDVPEINNRQSVRFQFPIPAGSTATTPAVTYSIDILSGDGNVIFGVYDAVADEMVPLTDFSGPPNAVLSLQTADTALFSHAQSGDPENMAGTYALTIDPTGYNIEDLELIVWQLGDFNSEESVGNITVDYTADAGVGCFTWNSPAAVAAWMNTKQPAGLAGTWFADADSNVCSDVPLGAGGLYGTLRSCSGGPVSPTVV